MTGSCSSIANLSWAGPEMGSRRDLSAALGYSVAGFLMLVEGVSDFLPLSVAGTYAPFLVSRRSDVSPDLEIHLQVCDCMPPMPCLDTPLFVAQRRGASRASWYLYETRDRFLIYMLYSQSDKLGVRRLSMTKDYSAGNLWLECKDSLRQPIPFPLEFPLDKILWMNFLARGRGVLLHACGIALDGEGYIFFGPQESGKSTLASLWQQHPGATVLNDECVAVRVIDDTLHVFGTPWTGRQRDVAVGGVPVRALFYISHGRENRAQRKRPMDSLRDLARESFLPYYDRLGIQYSLDLFTSIVETISIFDLSFVPTPEVVDFVQHIGS